MKNRRLLLVVTGLNIGGAEQVVCNLADYFSTCGGYRVVICTLIDAQRKLPQNKDVQIISLKMKKNPVSFLICLVRYLKLVKKFKPEIVHSHLFHSNIFCRFAKMFGGNYSLVSSIHSMNEGGAATDLLYKITDSLAAISTNVSKIAAEAFSERGAGRIIAIPNGLDVTRFVPSSANAKNHYFTILSVGRLTEVKNHKQLIGVFCGLHKKYKNIKLRIVGEGALEIELKKQVGDLGLGDSVVIANFSDDIVREYQSADLFVLPSLNEGFGLVVAEAMACGLPVVVSDSGGPSEIVGDLGTLIPVNNDEALSKAILAYLEMGREKCEEVGQKNRQRVIDFFSATEFYAKWASLYSLASSKRSNKLLGTKDQWVFQK